MPDLNGRELYRALLAADPEQAARVIFVSGDTLDDATLAWLHEAARPVIEKPFTPEDVRRVVALELRRAERNARAAEPAARPDLAARLPGGLNAS
jgi:DNA-binding response OmpR family regulator